jgi:hypothetical protein
MWARLDGSDTVAGGGSLMSRVTIVAPAFNEEAVI